MGFALLFAWFEDSLEIPKVGGEIEQELVKKGVLTQEQLAGFIKGTNVVWRDTVWAQAIIHMIETRQPNLLLYHPLNTDNINHMQGPGSFASFTAYAYVDRLVGDIVAALEKSGRPATVFVTTDHGFKKVSKVILPNVVLRKAGLLHAEGAQKVTCDAYAMVEGGLTFVYVTDPAKRAELKLRLRALFEKTEGVQQPRFFDLLLVALLAGDSLAPIAEHQMREVHHRRLPRPLCRV